MDNSQRKELCLEVASFLDKPITKTMNGFKFFNYETDNWDEMFRYIKGFVDGSLHVLKVTSIRDVSVIKTFISTKKHKVIQAKDLLDCRLILKEGKAIPVKV